MSTADWKGEVEALAKQRRISKKNAADFIECASALGRTAKPTMTIEGEDRAAVGKALAKQLDKILGNPALLGWFTDAHEVSGIDCDVLRRLKVVAEEVRDAPRVRMSVLNERIFACQLARLYTRFIGEINEGQLAGDFCSIAAGIWKSETGESRKFLEFVKESKHPPEGALFVDGIFDDV
jgi:hypothetical protein